VLEDEDIYNEEPARNAYFFKEGDVFEIFVRPETQDAYFEFHIGPDNQQLQLRIPSAEAFANQVDGECEGWKIAGPLMQSWVQVDAPNGVWRVLALLPFDYIVEEAQKSQDWLISFCRYDYTRGVKKPVISSSSPHAKLGFHRQHEWTRLRFLEMTTLRPNHESDPFHETRRRRSSPAGGRMVRRRTVGSSAGAFFRPQC
jgi:hypothetical protein